MKRFLSGFFAIVAVLLVVSAAPAMAQTYEPGQSGSNFGGPGDSISLRGYLFPGVAPAAGQHGDFNASSALFQWEGGENVVTFSATPTFSATTTVNYIQLTGNVTSSTLAAGLAGERTTFVICQDATGSRTFTWPTTVYNGGTIGTTASKCNVQDLVYSAALSKWVGTAILTNQ